MAQIDGDGETSHRTAASPAFTNSADEPFVFRRLHLTGYDEIGYLHPLLQLGIGGYLSKTATADEIVAAVRGVAAGQCLLDAVTRWTVEHGRVEPLTARELDVLQLVMAGQRNREIAATLSLSLATVEFHMSHILAKLGAHSRTEAVRAAQQRGILCSIPR